MRALVTGGHGFVGSHVVRRLLDRGRRVRCLYRRPGRPASLDGLDVEIAAGDVRDPESLTAALDRVDEVYHLAALTRSRTRQEIFATNATGTGNLLEASVGAGLPGRFLFCSSLAAAGPAPDGRPLTETDPCRPATWYGESKRAAELAVERYSDRLSTTIVRPPAVYGPGDVDFLAVFQAACRGVLPILGTRPRRYHFVYVEDLADGILAAAEADGAAGRLYYVTNDAEILSTEDFGAAVGRAVGRRGRRLALPDSLLKLVAEMGELSSQITGRTPLLNRQRMHELSGLAYLCSGAALARDTGFRATTGVDEGTRKTAAWYRERGQLSC